MPRLTTTCIAIAIAIAGCGEMDGADAHFPGTVTYDSPAGDFHFHLLEPPWIPIKLPTETFFVVPPSAITLSLATEADAVYSLHIYRHSTDAMAAFEAEAQLHSPPWDVSESRDVSSTGVTTGVDMSWTAGPTVYHRDAYIDGATPGASFRMHFTSKNPMVDDAMISQMIASFEPRPSGAQGAP